MQDPQSQRPPADAAAGQARPALDDDTLAFARRVFQAARAGNAAELGPLLDQGFPANLRNEKGDSLLMLASYHGQEDATRVLLEHGADPELQNDAGQSPLMGAAFKGNLAIAKLLLEHGAQPDGPGPDGKTPLRFAVMFNRVEIAQLLLDRGANPAALDSSGSPMIEVARTMGAMDAVALLAGLK
ncbi:hypothetical protein IP91_05113 [Pseudoduganella lurida]|uniref:Uncharacterized protein n=1 Tax=Pseudoduganella lurida TaxID=1036180 RepID=A0A562QUA7_9BURK|nr:ankyrin repeat domain-containing protein [Pseudoduganella lurida]TWI60418.1 hypothetical protein IP91_05113 [Pseudoduganella lurida]